MSAVVDLILKHHLSKAAQLVVWEEWTDGNSKIRLIRQTDKDSHKQFFRVKAVHLDAHVEHLVLSAPEFADLLENAPDSLLPTLIAQHGLFNLKESIAGMKFLQGAPLLEALPVKGARITIEPPCAARRLLSPSSMELIIRYEDPNILEEDFYPLDKPTLINALRSDIPVIQAALEMHPEATASIAKMDPRLYALLEKESMASISSEARPFSPPSKRPKSI